MKIVALLFVLVAAFCFAMKKTIDERVLLAERMQVERSISIEEQATAEPLTIALL